MYLHMQILATIAEIELPGKQCNNLIDSLLGNITTSFHCSSMLKQSTLQTIGYICESIVCVCVCF